MRYVVTLLVFLVLPALASAQGGAVPDVRFVQVGRDSCIGDSVSPQWEQELRDRLPELVALWRGVGPGMSLAVSKITGKPFTPPGQVNLTLCDVRSNSFFGVTVNMRYALEGFTASPVPLRYKMDTVFHEMLHEFVRHNTPRASAALKSHSSESRCVRNHLHLLALQKSVLLATDQSAALRQVVANDSLLPSGCYKRAWTLVNATATTYQELVAELVR